MSLYINDQEWVTIDEVQGELQAELLRSLLESQRIPVKLNQEGAGRAFGLSVGHLGTVQILVPSHLEQKASQILQESEAGLYEDAGEDGEEENE